MERLKLPAKLAKIEPNRQLLAQSVRVYLNNQRSALAKTKTRSEVEKTTAKMYKQKGTGRARHGAYSAPIFVGGGVAFGPTGRQNYDRKLSKSQTKLAIVSALKTKGGDLWNLTLDKIKATKDAAKKVSEIKGSMLVVLGEKEGKFGKYFRNISKVSVCGAGVINAYLILKHKNLLFTESALEEVAKKYVD